MAINTSMKPCQKGIKTFVLFLTNSVLGAHHLLSDNFASNALDKSPCHLHK